MKSFVSGSPLLGSGRRVSLANWQVSPGNWQRWHPARDHHLWQAPSHLCCMHAVLYTAFKCNIVRSPFKTISGIFCSHVWYSVLQADFPPHDGHIRNEYRVSMTRAQTVYCPHSLKSEYCLQEVTGLSVELLLCNIWPPPQLLSGWSS